MCVAASNVYRSSIKSKKKIRKQNKNQFDDCIREKRHPLFIVSLESNLTLLIEKKLARYPELSYGCHTTVETRHNDFVRNGPGQKYKQTMTTLYDSFAAASTILSCVSSSVTVDFPNAADTAAFATSSTETGGSNAILMNPSGKTLVMARIGPEPNKDSMKLP